jgi:membrane-bound metal-dependent hydrolase YbcI (DUF457 family)
VHPPLNHRERPHLLFLSVVVLLIAAAAAQFEEPAFDVLAVLLVAVAVVLAVLAWASRRVG